MSHAFAIGYDWLYDALSAEDRATIRRALVEKGLRPAGGRTPPGRAGRADPQLEPGLQRRHRHRGARHRRRGAGPGRHRARPGARRRCPRPSPPTRRTAPGRRARPTGSTAPSTSSRRWPPYQRPRHGLRPRRRPGPRRTGRFRLHVTGPTGLFFNFADASPARRRARRCSSGSPAATPIRSWPSPRARPRPAAPRPRPALVRRPRQPRPTRRLPLDARYQAAHLAFFRSAWNDKDAIYVGFKGGDNAANHAHLDLGTFVLDALGQRWAVDLGPDDYDLPGYFESPRAPAPALDLRPAAHQRPEHADPGRRRIRTPQPPAPLIAFGSASGRGLRRRRPDGGVRPRAPRVLAGSPCETTAPGC